MHTVILPKNTISSKIRWREFRAISVVVPVIVSGLRQLSVLEKSANNSAVSSSVATAPLKPIQDEGMARCGLFHGWVVSLVGCSENVTFPCRRLMSRGSTGWSEGFRDEDVFEGNAGSHAARNVSPALSGAFVSPELRRSPIMTPRSAGVNPSSGDRQFVFGDGGKSPKHGGSPKHNGSPKSFSGPRPPSVVGVRGRSPSPERSDNVFQSSSVSALSAFDAALCKCRLFDIVVF